MSIKYYFSKDQNKRAEFIFNLIAPIYARMNNFLGKGYVKIMKKLTSKIDINNKTVLDIGSGTGVWGASFLQHGAKSVKGIDFAEKMVYESSRDFPEIMFEIGDAEDLSSIDDNSFDIVTASLVIHGVTKDKREKILLEMKRVSKQYVVLHDFKGDTPHFVRILEFMERSDYKHFKSNICNELKDIFSKAESFQLPYGSGLYIMEI
ncbi:MAG: class I SAM-dependent methyltransferase [Ichthyobacteriaceae bacterium]|nr:class I SAM-dependent methyltransferase [Ichthyobacteriaceae bacterium]